MKSTLLILAFVVIVILGAILILEPSNVSPTQIHFTFIGYTNTGGAVEALFSVHLPPNHTGGGFGWPEVSRKEGTVWKHENNIYPPPKNMRLFTKPTLDPSRCDVFAAITVGTTNVPSHIVTKIDEKPQREWQIISAARNLGAKLGLDTSRSTGLTYFITNETGIVTDPPDRR